MSVDIGQSVVLPEQLGTGSQPMRRKDEFTGMVWCPMKMGEIAIMRCAEYQKAHGCGNTKMLLAKTLTPGERRKTYSLVNFQLRLAAMFPWLKATGKCATRALPRQIRALRVALETYGAAENTKTRRGETVLCVQCGEPKKTDKGPRCRTCAAQAGRVKGGRARAAQMRLMQLR